MQGGMAPRRSGRGAVEAKAPSARRDCDVNRERLVFCLTSLVGHKVTAKLRNNIIYEGLFHSCSVDSDFSITLKSARLLPSETTRSGEVINTLLISGKDFLQVSAVDVPPPCEEGGAGHDASAGFQTDGEIAAKRAAALAGERELVPWNPGGDDSGALEGGGELWPARGGSNWDQFHANEHLYGVGSTYNEELYTTKLDTNALSEEKRQEAHRIAREIEQGQMAADVDGRMEEQDQDDSEEMFSAVPRHGKGYRDHLLDNRPSNAVPLTEEHLYQHDRDSLSTMPADGFAREHRTKRGMITQHSAHSPMRSPMISEMKRINALNLEPALPKLDDKTRTDWINFKQSQSRTAFKAVQGNCVKSEFLQALDTINKREAAAKTNREQAGVSQPSDAVESTGVTPGAGQMSKGGPSPSGDQVSSPAGGESKKPFTFNIAAATFTPGGSQQPATPSAAMSQAPTPSNAANAKADAKATRPPSAVFKSQVAETEWTKMSLDAIMGAFYDGVVGDRNLAARTEWKEATGSPYREVLGQPTGTPIVPQQMQPPQPGAPNAPANWQPQMQQNQQQQAPGQLGPQNSNAPGQMPTGGPGGPGQMGFMVQASPGTNPGGQQQPPMYPQMFQPPGGGVRPANGNGGMGGPQQPMHMNQPGGQGMNMGGPMGGNMGPGQGPVPPMGAVPKFGGQMVPMVMGPGNQFGQGFVPNQGQPGQPGMQGQMMQPQGQMGMQGWGMPDGRRPSGGGMEG